MRIYMKIQYITDEKKRVNKCLSAAIYNTTHKTQYKQYQKNYHKEYKAKNIISVS